MIFHKMSEYFLLAFAGSTRSDPAMRTICLCLTLLALVGAWPARADSDPAHQASGVERPQTWPGGIIPYDISKLTATQQTLVQRAMQRWMDTRAKIKFVPRTTELEYV